MKINLLAAATVAALLLSGCARPGVYTPSGDAKADFHLTRLFTTPEGCVVYRFYDAAYYRYLTVCEGSISTQRSSGKTHRPDEIPTEVVGQ